MGQAAPSASEARKTLFLLAMLALAFYNVGMICVMQADVFPSWRLLDFETFQRVRGLHWQALPLLVFVPVGVSLMGAVVLLRYHPDGTPRALLWRDWPCSWRPTC